MTNEEILQKTLNVTLERFAKQVLNYEAEIANLNAQLLSLSSSIDELRKPVAAEASPTTRAKKSAS
jgi:prefoldin subunit 5